MYFVLQFKRESISESTAKIMSICPSEVFESDTSLLKTLCYQSNFKHCNILHMEEQPTSHGNSESIYYKLMEEVGVNGKYQTWFIILSSALFVQIGFIQLGIPYYFAVAPYSNCPQPYEGITLCTQYACTKPYAERVQYENEQIKELRTLGTQFGDYHCQKSDQIEAAMGVNYLGAIIGYLITGILADNIGRRITLLLCQLLTVGGFVAVLLAPTLLVAEVGLFFVGFGVQSFLPVCYCIIAEIMENKHRQKIQILMQVVFSLGGILIVVLFAFFKNWKTIFFWFSFLPSLICLIFTYFFVKETPQFLLKLYSIPQIRESMRFIAEINQTSANFDQSYLLSEDHLFELQEDYQEEMQGQHKKAFTYFDLVRYPSLRSTSIWAFLLFICSSLLYFGPLIIVDQFGFDFYINGIIFNVPEIITFAYAYLNITTLKRRYINIFTFIATLLCSFGLIFLNDTEVCTQNCWNFKQIAELLVFFTLRIAVSLQYQVIFIYVSQLYPAQVAALGLGFGCIIVALPNIFLPELINLLNKVGFKIMVVFCIVAVIAIGVSFPLKQTDGKHPQEKIEELVQIEHHHPIHHFVKEIEES